MRRLCVSWRLRGSWIAIGVFLTVWAVPAAVAQNNAQNRDLSGVWIKTDSATLPWAPGRKTIFAAEVPLQRWAMEHCRKVGCGRGTDSAGTPWGTAYLQGEDPVFIRCAPQGFPRLLLSGGAMEIFHTAKRVFMRFYFGNEMRQIWVDGRGHPESVNTTWHGDSIGRWDGDALVVDTVGILGGEQGKFKWLDPSGNPHSDDLRVVERIRRSDPKTLVFDVRFEDPGAFTAPFSGTLVYTLNPDAEPGRTDSVPEYVQCEDRIYADTEGEAWPFVTGDYPKPNFPPVGPER